MSQLVIRPDLEPEVKTVTVDLRHAPKGLFVTVVAPVGVMVWRCGEGMRTREIPELELVEKGDAMRELTVRLAMRPEQVAK